MVFMNKYIIVILVLYFTLFLLSSESGKLQAQTHQRVKQQIDSLRKLDKIVEINRLLNRNTNLDLEYFQKNLNENIVQATKNEDMEALASTYLSYGNFWYLQGNHLKAFENYKECEILSKENNLPVLTGLSLMNQSNVTQNLNDRLTLLKKAAFYFEQSADTLNLAKVYLNLGNSYSSFVLGEIVLSTSYSSEIIPKTHLSPENQKLYKDTAFYFYDKVKILNELFRHPEISASYYLRMAQWNRNDSDFTEAASNYATSAEYFTKARLMKGYVYVTLELALMYVLEKKYDTAISLSDSVVVLSKQYGFNDYYSRACRNLAQVYEMKNDFQKAVHYYKLYSQSAISIHQLEKDEKINALNLAYKIKEQQNLIDFMSQQRRINQLTINIILTVVFFTAIALYLIVSARKRKMVALIETIEKDNKINEMQLQLLNSQLENKQLQTQLQEEKIHAQTDNIVSIANQMKKLETHYENLSVAIHHLAKTMNADLHQEEIKNLKLSLMQIANEQKSLVEISSFSEQINQDFFMYIDKNYADITKEDKNLLSMLIIDLSSKQIGEYLNISTESVYKKRYRLRKRLNIPNETSFIDFYKQTIQKMNSNFSDPVS